MRIQPQTRAGIALLIAAAVLVACGRGAAPETPAPEDDQVETGYGGMKPGTVTGAVSSSQVDSPPVQTWEQLLRRHPGVEVLRSGGGQFTVRIRGSSSVNSGNEPLLVVDGVQIGGGTLWTALNAVDPSDVRRIDVLKDASASALYGSRGGNGVIVVTTHRP